MADAVSVAGDHYTVLEENDKVRILEFKGKPGDKTEMHSHPAVVAIPLPTGDSMEIELGAGHAMYMDAAEHATEVLGTDDSHVILVELK